MQCFLIYAHTKAHSCWWNRITMMPVIQLANKPHVLVIFSLISFFTNLRTCRIDKKKSSMTTDWL